VYFDHHVHPEHGPYHPGTYPLSWIEAYLAVGRERGVAGIGLVEHGYRFLEAAGLLPTPWAEARCRYPLEAYTRLCDEVRTALGVAVGLEMDYVPGREDAIRAYLSRYRWDFVLGSVHWLGDFGLDVAEMRDRYAERPLLEIWREYYRTQVAMVATGLFDVVTHPDLPKIFGGERPPEDELLPLYRSLVEALADTRVALELNTSGLRRPVREMYPTPALLAMAARAGVPLVLASDAHEPENVGYAFDAAAELARRAGFREAAGFRDGQRVALPL
jgi:histidinol-phosphatase (PHP family)